jgi:hypothetical protein
MSGILTGLPGILTGLGALIAAIVGLMAYCNKPLPEKVTLTFETINFTMFSIGHPPLGNGAEITIKVSQGNTQRTFGPISLGRGTTDVSYRIDKRMSITRETTPWQVTISLGVGGGRNRSNSETSFSIDQTTSLGTDRQHVGLDDLRPTHMNQVHGLVHYVISQP